MEATKQIVVPEGMQKKEWFNVKEFATGVGMTPHAVNQWIHRHPEFSQKYCQNISASQKRVRWLIYWEGISAFLTLHSGRTGNQYRSKDTLTRGLDVAKENVAIKANEAIKGGNGQLSPAQALLQAVQLMVSLEQKLNNVEVRAEAHEQKLVQLEKKVEQNSNELKKPLPIGSIHRQFLNDRVRMYAINQSIEFSRVWRKINEYVGRGGVAFYEFADYQKALKFTKNLFEEAGMSWD